MRRFHKEVPLMLRRQRVERAKHTDHSTGEVWGCDCLKGPGPMRKHRPYEACLCRICRGYRILESKEKRSDLLRDRRSWHWELGEGVDKRHGL